MAGKQSEAELIVSLYEALRHIAKDYQSPAQLQRGAEREFGLSYGEALEMAYENLQWEASRAIKGVRIAKYRAAAKGAA